MKKVILITGARGAGKTTAAITLPKATAEEMDQLLVVDTEDSTSDIYKGMEKVGMPFHLIRAYERFKFDDDMLSLIADNKLPWVTNKQKGAIADYFDWFKSELDNRLENGKFKYLVIDTIEPIEAAMAAWAEANKNLSGWSGTKAYGRLEVEAVRPMYENLLEAISRRGVEFIVLTSHIKRVWEDDKPVPNKVQPGGRLAVLSRLSSSMFWLVPNHDNANGEPSAIVLKARLGNNEPDKETGRWKTRRVLPERIPAFSWSMIDYYREHPADLANPQPGEVMTQAENEMISEFFTDEQMRLMVIGAERKLMQDTPPPLPFVHRELTSELEVAIIGMLQNGMSPAEIAREVPGVTIPMVFKLQRDTSV